MKIKIAVLTALCLLLTGCGTWMDGSYSWEEPHTEPGVEQEQEITSVSDYTELRDALTQMIDNGELTRTISVAEMGVNNLASNMMLAIHYATRSYHMGAYAVEAIHYEIGTSGGVAAVVVTIQYNHNYDELLKISSVYGMDVAKGWITKALDDLEPGIVLKITGYENTDYTQLVQDYALMNPDKVMEVPQVVANVYPAKGSVRVLELKFTYQTSRESLKSMQEYVQPIFTSGELFVKYENETPTKFARLYAFLMETTDYTVETSITPTYSLLRHGVGDSKAFASVYAAMCRKVGMDCQVISGTHEGAPWFWNIICEDGTYYHVDLLRCYREGGYQKLTDQDMLGYVWDYAAYPACDPGEEDIQENQDTTGLTETTEETETTEATEATETTEATEEAEATETTEATEATEATETTEATEATEATETTEATEEMESKETTEESGGGA